MTFIEFLNDSEWDTPFFKKLAHNDTGQAAGHQAGMVLPKDLRVYLPGLDERATSSIAPTTDRPLQAELFLETIHKKSHVVRYQFQTWGGTRSPESRITEGFQTLRDEAREGDLILFQRRIDAFDAFRLILVRQTRPEFLELVNFVNTRRWGALFVESEPVNQAHISEAIEQIDSLVVGDFRTTRPSVARIETRQSRIARCSVFRRRVRSEYDRSCAVSGICIASPDFLYEVESAHIVPLSKGGTDDIRNGFSLSQTLHWAFDRGLFGVRQNRTIYIPHRVKSMQVNQYLREFEGRSIAEAITPSLRVHPDAFKWHRENVVIQWE
jgi:putative restriction endonuclease